MENIKNKNLSIQMFRSIIICFVVFIHLFPMYTEVNASEIIPLITLRTIFCNLAVPSFFYLSGMLFSTEKYEKQKWQYIIEKVKRLLIPLLIWNFIFGSKYLIENGITLKNVLKVLLFKSYGHLYFVIVLIQLLISIPLLLKILKSKYKVILYIITPLYLLIYRILWIKFNFVIPFHQYFVFGWLIYYILGLDYQKKLATCQHGGVLIFLTSMLSTLIFNIIIYKITRIYDCAISLMNCVAMINNIIFIKFILNFIIAKKVKLTNEFWLVKIGDRSFGIYFIHPLLIDLAKSYIKVQYVYQIIILGLIIFFACYAIISIFSKLTKGKFDKILGFI